MRFRRASSSSFSGRLVPRGREHTASARMLEGMKPRFARTLSQESSFGVMGKTRCQLRSPARPVEQFPWKEWLRPKASASAAWPALKTQQGSRGCPASVRVCAFLEFVMNSKKYVVGVEVARRGQPGGRAGHCRESREG